jgi:hypothetical protein
VLVPGKSFQPCLQIGSYLSEALLWWGRLLAYPQTSISLGWKCLIRRNTLAYYEYL